MEAHHLKFGDKVIAKATVTRQECFEGYSTCYRSWVRRPYRTPKEGMFIGFRTLANGDMEYSADGRTFHPTQYFRVALVVFDIKTNPVYVKFEDLVGAFLFEDPTINQVGGFALERLINEVEANLCSGPRASYWRPVVQAARMEYHRGESAFNDQTRELEIAVRLLEEIGANHAMEYRYRAYPNLWPRP